MNSKHIYLKNSAVFGPEGMIQNKAQNDRIKKSTLNVEQMNYTQFRKDFAVQEHMENILCINNFMNLKNNS